jgi:hypothetical protein
VSVCGLTREADGKANAQGIIIIITHISLFLGRITPQLWIHPTLHEVELF